MKRKRNLKKLLNLGYLDYTNLTPKIGELDMPYVCCKSVPKIDYLATYSKPSTYFHSPNTAVSFFEYDIFFDGLYGLWNAIRYGIKELQEYYIERFHGVRWFIAPDYSKCGDVPEVMNHYSQFKSRISSIWLTMNCRAGVIPLVSCANEIGMKYMLDGMDDCMVVAFNAKGALGDSRQLPVFINSVEYAVKHLPKLRSIIVNSSSPDSGRVRQLFQCAIDNGIDVQIPDNQLQTRNRLLGGASDGID